METEMKKLGINIWRLVVMLSSIVTQIENSELTGEQKKLYTINKITEFLRPFNIPLPEFVLNAILSPLIDMIVDNF
ncbi:MAG TPA: hypothetical protein PK466_14220, partial [Thermotogota bacterium]|nr:hypothetical protein [Thermotogota bacterium]